jgi:LysM repeat protein
MDKVFGIDISAYQPNINLAVAKNEGVQFTILRAGYTGYGNGVSKVKDSCFERHYANAKANGLGVGAYWYSCATTYENGRAEAEFMYNNCLKGKSFEYPIYIDVEDGYYQAKAGKNAVTNAIKGFCEYLEAKGFYVGIYANTNWFNNFINTNDLARYDKWIASWGTAKPSYPSGGLWQFGGETNRIRTNKVAGVTCDQNYAYYDYPSIMKSKGLNGFTANNVTPSKPVAPTRKSDEEIAIEIINDVNNAKWGTTDTNPTRRQRLESAGYNYDTVQAIVNQKLGIHKSQNNRITYIVKAGDTLSKIASIYGTTYQKIAKDNGINNPNLIYVGQKIVIEK